MKPSIVNRIKSNWTLKRLGKVAMTVAFLLGNGFPIISENAGNGGSSCGLGR
ncbi:hypothetical protein EfmJHP36_27370 [Enterococcus faecium]|nr:hypothetical protein EfmJHP36_27370 [Enterococcus faecium]